MTFDYGFPDDLALQFERAVDETLAENPRGEDVSSGYERPVIDAAWRVAVQPKFMKGGSIVEGTCTDKPAYEAVRMDWHVFVFRVGDLPPRKLTEINCHPRDLAIYDFGLPNVVQVFMNGGNWRSGTTLWILEWHLDTGEIETMFEVGGDEFTENTGYRLTIGPEPSLILYGVVKDVGYQDDADRLSGRLRIPVRMEPCGASR